MLGGPVVSGNGPAPKCGAFGVAGGHGGRLPAARNLQGGKVNPVDRQVLGHAYAGAMPAESPAQVLRLQLRP